MQPLDEYELTGHSLNWRADLESVRDYGATAVRYGVNWPLVHTAENTFDWAMLDERLAFASVECKLTVIADLVHYGTPTWLGESFADPRYPQAIAAFAGAFAARYRGIVDHITPLNEPTTTASFCGLRGVWPPLLTGWSGWTTVTMGIVSGMAHTIRAVRAANPEAVIVHVEASSLIETSDPALADHADLLRNLNTLPTDLLLGRVTTDHPLHAWLIENGASPLELDDLTRDSPTVDLMGVNYYPNLTPRVVAKVGGQIVQIAHNRWQEGLAESLHTFAHRYGLPIIITETSIEGDDETRLKWLADSAHTIELLRADGLDIRGYTWWPWFDFVDWSFASGGKNVEEFVLFEEADSLADAAPVASGVLGDPVNGKTPFLRRMGLFRLDEEADGSLTRVATLAAGRFAELTGAVAPQQIAPVT